MRLESENFRSQDAIKVGGNLYMLPKFAIFV